jgi:hypothetical protein
MSAIAQAAATIAATPLPSPQVIKEVFTNNVPVQVPAYVLQLAQVLALAGATAFMSLVHALSERGKWSSTVNRAVVTGYTLAAAVAATALSGHLGTNVNQLQSLLTDFLVALGSALGSYNLVFKSILSAFGFTSTAPADTATLATEADPAIGVG